MAASEDAQIVTGEENERLIWKHRCRLYRSKEGEWKQRGLGDVTILQHKEQGNVRVVMRQEKTFKVVMNHYVNPSDANKLELNFGDERTRVWSTIDFSDDGQDTMTFAIKFPKAEEAAKFEELFNSAKKINGTAEGEKKEQLPDYVDPLADEPEKVKVALESKDDAADASKAKSPSGKELWKQILEEKAYKPLPEDDLKKLWHKYDKDKSDSIDKSELNALYLDLIDALFEKLEVPLDDSSRDGVKSEADVLVAETLAKLDTDHDKKLSWDEFKKLTDLKFL